MTNFTKWIAIACLAAAAFIGMPALTSAQQNDLGVEDPTAAAPPPEFIAPADVKKMVDTNATGFVLVDTQPEEAFAEGHVPGAINYPWVDKVKPPISLPRNKMLILYCPCNHDEDSIDMANKLREFGYLNTKILEGGWYKWVALKYPVVGTDAANAIKSADAAAGNGAAEAVPAAATTAATTTATTSAPASSQSANASGAITSGRGPGAITPSFRVLDVTGKYKGTETCYVCEYGTAPTVIAFFQNTGDETADLIVKLDKLIDSRKDLKGVAVIEVGPEAKPWLEKLAQDKRIKIPLVVFQNGTNDSGVRVYKLNLQAKNTFLVNDKRLVVANFANVSGDTFQQVADASAKMLGGD
jgi:rhodanese-related sulfurtransferase